MKIKVIGSKMETYEEIIDVIEREDFTDSIEEAENQWIAIHGSPDVIESEIVEE